MGGEDQPIMALITDLSIIRTTQRIGVAQKTPISSGIMTGVNDLVIVTETGTSGIGTGSGETTAVDMKGMIVEDMTETAGGIWEGTEDGMMVMKGIRGPSNEGSKLEVAETIDITAVDPELKFIEATG